MQVSSILQINLSMKQNFRFLLMLGTDFLIISERTALLTSVVIRFKKLKQIFCKFWNRKPFKQLFLALM